MSAQKPPVLGRCPHCNTEIASFDARLEYEPLEGTPSILAECPDCGRVVHPE